jgi:D-xylose transport system ATP-binding protein
MFEDRSPTVEFEGISKEFSGNVALKDISLKLYPGVVTGLFGGNAAGKSTLIKILTGEFQPTKGVVRFGRQCYRGLSYALARRLGVVTVYQDLALCPRLNAIENIFLGCEEKRCGVFLDRVKMREMAGERITRLGIKLMDLTRPVHELSGGQKQAVALARIFDPTWTIFLLDEPTSALAESLRFNVHRAIRDLAAIGKTILYVSHDLIELRAIADCIVTIEHGHIGFNGIAEHFFRTLEPERIE